MGPTGTVCWWPLIDGDCCRTVSPLSRHTWLWRWPTGKSSWELPMQPRCALPETAGGGWQLCGFKVLDVTEEINRLRENCQHSAGTFTSTLAVSCIQTLPGVLGQICILLSISGFIRPHLSGCALPNTGLRKGHRAQSRNKSRAQCCRRALWPQADLLWEFCYLTTVNCLVKVEKSNVSASLNVTSGKTESVVGNVFLRF